MSPRPVPAPTGRRELRDGVAHVVLERSFRATADDVWAAVTEPARLERWIGTWTGDPAAGRVDFQMTAEGDDAPVEVFTIEVCEPPHRLVVRSQGEDGAVWHLTLDLAEADGVTTLAFAQATDDAEVAADVGPGWDYYLDRLVAAESGDDAASVAWADYEGLSPHYRSLWGRAT